MFRFRSTRNWIRFAASRLVQVVLPLPCTLERLDRLALLTTRSLVSGASCSSTLRILHQLRSLRDRTVRTPESSLSTSSAHWALSIKTPSRALGDESRICLKCCPPLKNRPRKKDILLASLDDAIPRGSGSKDGNEDMLADSFRRLQQLKDSGVVDPDVDLWLALERGDKGIAEVKDALDRHANPNVSLGDVLSKYEDVDSGQQRVKDAQLGEPDLAAGKEEPDNTKR